MKGLFSSLCSDDVIVKMIQRRLKDTTAALFISFFKQRGIAAAAAAALPQKKISLSFACILR